ncbi:uncharacterized protein [Paralichthys olivaceus]|uniref:uncharacterized protein isoform X2 n=1 Tax=Paralichthys olivaceus TaxID=8255 RepID=UPI00375289B2
MIPLYLSQELDILSPCRYSCIHSVRTYCTCCSNTHTTPTEVKEGKEEGKHQKPHFKTFDKTDKMTDARKSEKSKKQKGTTLCSSTTRYLVKERIGEGCFSSVVRAVNLSTSEEVAIKILKDKKNAKKEFAMLKVLEVLDPVKNNLVHFIEKFRYNGQTCLVFEKLDMDLHGMQEMLGRGMTLHEIRPIAHQLLTTLKALKSIGVVHSDIKPDNIMVVDPHATPLRVKLIDFGLSFKIHSKLGQKCQPLGYRAPEVSLGLPFSEAIDMWGLACVLLFLYLNAHPFPNCEYQTVKAVVGLLGLPADHLLKAGMYTDMFFKEDQYWSKPGWWLKISEEFYGKRNKAKKVLFKTLDDLIPLYPLSEGSMELSDRRAFFSLIKASWRWTQTKGSPQRKHCRTPSSRCPIYWNRQNHNKMTDARKSEKSKKPKGTVLCSSTTRYLVKERIGEGCFSSVVRAVNLSTSEEVAIKILKDKKNAKKEFAMLKVLEVLDPVKNNLVHFIEKFRYNGQTCLVFEKLDMDLHGMQEMLGRGMTLHEIRPIAHQLLTTLKALKSIGVVHSDIKPDNVMVVDPHATPLRVKLIDFGLSSNIPSKLGQKCQPLGYRAPEVSLGLPFSEAIDMWGLACVLLFLYLNAHPFPSCEYQTVKAVVGLLGLPADHLLKAGMYTDMFFKEDQYWSKPGWWLKISEEFYGKRNKAKKVLFKTLDDLITLYPLSEGSMELSERRAFFSLIKGLLEMDPDRRLTPEEALSLAPLPHHVPYIGTGRTIFI